MPTILQIVACILVASVIVRPTKQQSAEKICATEHRSVSLYCEINTSRTGKMKFEVVCNEQKNAIKKCVLKSSDDYKGGKMMGLSNVPTDGFPASSEPTKFGGDFGNMYELDCSETAAPKGLTEKWFSEQVCNTPSQSKMYEVKHIPQPVNVKFFCNAANTEIEFCKPDGLIGKIKAHSVGWFGGPLHLTYRLRCEKLVQPTFLPLL